MKNVAFVCVLFLFFACKKDLTFKTETFYIEKDSTTAYLGQKTVKVTSFDTSNGKYCTSSVIRFINLSSEGFIKIYFVKDGQVIPSIAVIVNSNPNGAFGDEKLDLCSILPCGTKECPTAIDLIPLMRVSYDKRSTYARKNEARYVEKDSTSAFMGQETLNLISSDSGSTYRSVIGSYIENCHYNLFDRYFNSLYCQIFYF